MLSPWIVVGIAIITAIILAVASILCIVGAVDSYGSPDYNKDGAIRNAHTYLTIAGTLGAIIAAMLGAIVIMMAFKATRPGVDAKEITRILSMKDAFSHSDKVTLDKDRIELNDLRKSMTILLLLFGVFAVIGCFAVGVLAAMAAAKLGNATKSSKVASAYTASIIAAILGIPAAVLAVIAVIIGFIMTEKSKKLTEMSDKVLDEAQPVPQSVIKSK